MHWEADGRRKKPTQRHTWSIALHALPPEATHTSGPALLPQCTQYLFRARAGASHGSTTRKVGSRARGQGELCSSRRVVRKSTKAHRPGLLPAVGLAAGLPIICRAWWSCLLQADGAHEAGLRRRGPARDGHMCGGCERLEPARTAWTSAAPSASRADTKLTGGRGGSGCESERRAAATLLTNSLAVAFPVISMVWERARVNAGAPADAFGVAAFACCGVSSQR